MKTTFTSLARSPTLICFQPPSSGRIRIQGFDSFGIVSKDSNKTVLNRGQEQAIFSHKRSN